MKAIISDVEFNGKALLRIQRTKDEKYPLQIGLKKARLIVENIGEIRAFIMRQEERYDGTNPR